MVEFTQKLNLDLENDNQNDLVVYRISVAVGHLFNSCRIFRRSGDSIERMAGKMNQPVVKRSLAELDTVLDEIVQRNPKWYKEIQQLVEKLKLKQQSN